jgi:hypothetical protein
MVYLRGMNAGVYLEEGFFTFFLFLFPAHNGESNFELVQATQPCGSRPAAIASRQALRKLER